MRRRVDLSRRGSWRCVRQNAPTVIHLTRVCPRVLVHGVKLSALSAVGLLGGADCLGKGRFKAARREHGRNTSFLGSLIGLDSGLKDILQRCLAACDEDRRLVPHACLPQGALPPGRVRGKCPHAARLHHQRAGETWKQGVDRIRRVPSVRLLLGPTVGTLRDFQHRRSYAGTLCMRSRCAVRFEIRRPGPRHGTQRAHRGTIQAG